MLYLRRYLVVEVLFTLCGYIRVQRTFYVLSTNIYYFHMFKLLIRRIITLLTHRVRKFIIVVTEFERNCRLHKFASTRFSLPSRTNTPFIGNTLGRSDSSRRQTGKGPKPDCFVQSWRLDCRFTPASISPWIILNSQTTLLLRVIKTLRLRGNFDFLFLNFLLKRICVP